MKNFKKVLALVLVVATLLSFATVASAADFKDAKAISNTEAVEVLSAIGVLKGYTDGEFKPTNVITRAEAAKIIAMFDNGDTDIDELYAPVNFSDVQKGHWAESFISYCYHTGIIAGVGNNKYAPSDDVTGVQFLKMVLVVLGFDAKEEGLTGTGYAVRTRALARELGLLAGIGNDFDYTKGLTRENAAQIMLNALTIGTAEYGKTFSVGGTSWSNLYVAILDSDAHINPNKTLADAWDLYVTEQNDIFGRPTWTWKIATSRYPNSAKQYDVIGTYQAAPVASFTTAFTGCDLYDELGVVLTKGETEKFEIWTDGIGATAVETIPDSTSAVRGAQGQLTEVYEISKSGKPSYRVVHINTYLAKVTKVNAEVKDSKGHVQSVRSLNLTGYIRTNNANYNEGTANATFTTSVASEDFAAGDYVLLTGKTEYTQSGRKFEVASIEAAESKTQKVTSVATGSNYNTVGLDGEKTKVACKFAYDSDPAVADVGTQKVVYFDAYGNVIGLTEPAVAAAQYAVLDKMYIEYAKGDATVYASLILFDGESTKKDVTVGKIKYNAVTMTAWKWIAESDDLVSNGQQFQWAGSSWYTTYFYQKVVNYVENADGTTDFQITVVRDLATGNIKITKGKKYINSADTTMPILTASDKTVYMVQTTAAPNAKYASYVGYENVPSMTTTAAAQYVKAADGTVALIYIYKPTLPTYSAYVYYGGDNKFVEYDGAYNYTVDVLGETEIETVTVVSAKEEDNLFTSGKGIYQLTYNADNKVVDAKPVESVDAYKVVTLYKTRASSTLYVYSLGDSSSIATDAEGYVYPTTGNEGKFKELDVSAVKTYNVTNAAALDGKVVELWVNASGNVIAVFAR